MSPVSRGRQGRKTKKPTRASDMELAYEPGLAYGPGLVDVAGTGHCPSCSGHGYDPDQLIDEMTAAVADVAAGEDPLAAEIAGAAVVSVIAVSGAAFEDVLVSGFIPAFEARASSEALTMLLAVSSVAPARAAKAAAAAADRLVEAGHTLPGWTAELRAPVSVADCRRIDDTTGIMSVLVGTFARAGRSHTAVVAVNHLDCGAAGSIQVIDTDEVAEVVEQLLARGRSPGLEIVEEKLDPAEFRMQVEQALDSRAVHDEGFDLGALDDDDEDEDLPGYHAMAVLLRARINPIAVSGKHRTSPASHDGLNAGLAALVKLAGLTGMPGMGDLAGIEGLAGTGGLGGIGGAAFRPGRQTWQPALPAKPRRSRRSMAPIYQIKAGLRGAKPPIWRRLEVPADISLATLHMVIQVAFGWDGGHLHVFETPYGEFGVADDQLGHQPEAPVTLEQVAPGVKSTIRYTYDFGDDWEHDIVVEKVLDRNDTVTYPRCTGGRRAAPPDDCGGVWGYAELVDTLRDPTHPEHEDRMEWMGLTDVAGFDPEDFDAASITMALSRLS